MQILLLAGGDSAEREVSLASGQCVSEALRGRGHSVDVLDPAIDSLPESAAEHWDVAFPVVHGTGGEDGVLQARLCKIGLPYVGSSVAASELTFDKIRTNQFLTKHGIAVPASVVVSASESVSQQIAAIETLLPFSDDHDGVVTKPSRQGSSIGVSIVRSTEDLPEALRLSFEHDEQCLVERFIAGREITIPIIDGRALPAIEICPAGEWYDYVSKYADDRTRYIVSPDQLPGSIAETAVKACQLCDVTGIARVDFRVDAAGAAWLLEINTVPGMTSHSLVPKSAAALGWSLGELCESAIRTALSDSRSEDSKFR